MSDEQKATTRSLPGFLRRSLRMNYSDDQEEKEESSAASETEATPANGEAASDTNKTTDEEPRPESPQATAKETEEQKSEASTAEETNASVEPPSWSSAPKPTQQPLQRTVSYKQAMFEKAIGADVVSMSDLRRLGWNGIPVCVGWNSV